MVGIMVEIKSQRELERIARMAETLEIRSENYGKKHYLIGPKDAEGRIYWPDTVLMSEVLARIDPVVVNGSVKISGTNVRLTFENGHGSYHVLGRHLDYVVMAKLSSSIDHVVGVP